MSSESRSSYCLSGFVVVRVQYSDDESSRRRPANLDPWADRPECHNCDSVARHFMYLSPRPRGYVTGGSSIFYHNFRLLSVGTANNARQKKCIIIVDIVGDEGRTTCGRRSTFRCSTREPDDVSGYRLPPRWSCTSDSMTLSANSRIAFKVRIEKWINPWQTLKPWPMTSAAGVVGSNFSVTSTIVTISVFSSYLHKTRHLVVQRNVWRWTTNRYPISHPLGHWNYWNSRTAETNDAGRRRYWWFQCLSRVYLFLYPNVECNPTVCK